MHPIARLAAAAMIGLGFAGCSSTEHEAQIRERDQDIATLQQENQDLRGRVAQKEATVIDLRKKLEAKPREVVVEKAVPVAAIVEKPATALKNAGFQVDERAEGTAVVLEGGILFESGQAILTAAGKASIDKLVRILKSDYAGRKISIEGHTDNQPIRITARGFKSNWDLSYARAKAVFDELSSAGISAGTMAIACFADTRPRANNKTDSGRRENRRVEVLLEK